MKKITSVSILDNLHFYCWVICHFCLNGFCCLPLNTVNRCYLCAAMTSLSGYYVLHNTHKHPLTQESTYKLDGCLWVPGFELKGLAVEIVVEVLLHHLPQWIKVLKVRLQHDNIAHWMFTGSGTTFCESSMTTGQHCTLVVCWLSKTLNGLNPSKQQLSTTLTSCQLVLLFPS